MNEFTDALRMKRLALEDELDECEDTMSRIKSKIEVLSELLVDEEGADVPSKPSTPTPARGGKKGRPRGSKNKKPVSSAKKATGADDGRVVFSEAEQAALDGMEGTDPELAKRLANRKFVASPRGNESYGPGVHPGKGKDTSASTTPKTDSTISIDDGE